MPDVYNRLDAQARERTRVVNSQLDQRLLAQQNILAKYRLASERYYRREKKLVSQELHRICHTLPTVRRIRDFRNKFLYGEGIRKPLSKSLPDVRPTKKIRGIPEEKPDQPFCQRCFIHHLPTKGKYYRKISSPPFLARGGGGGGGGGGEGGGGVSEETHAGRTPLPPLTGSEFSATTSPKQDNHQVRLAPRENKPQDDSAFDSAKSVVKSIDPPKSERVFCETDVRDDNRSARISDEGRQSDRKSLSSRESGRTLTLPPLASQNGMALDALCLDALCLDALCLDALCLDALCLDALCLDALCLDALCLDALCLDALCLDALCLDALCLDALCLDALCLDALCLDALCLDALCLDALCLDALCLDALCLDALCLDALCLDALCLDALCLDALCLDALCCCLCGFLCLVVEMRAVLHYQRCGRCYTIRDAGGATLSEMRAVLHYQRCGRCYTIRDAGGATLSEMRAVLHYQRCGRCYTIRDAGGATLSEMRAVLHYQRCGRCYTIRDAGGATLSEMRAVLHYQRCGRCYTMYY
ncbi:hypothetical protein ACOMHN_060364 [Nucella lapillus]